MAAAVGASSRTRSPRAAARVSSLGHHARLAGAGQSLDQAQVGSVQGLGDGLALNRVQSGVEGRPEVGMDRLQVGRRAGEQPGQELAGPVGRGAVAGGR